MIDNFDSQMDANEFWHTRFPGSENMNLIAKYRHVEDHTDEGVRVECPRLIGIEIHLASGKAVPVLDVPVLKDILGKEGVDLLEKLKRDELEALYITPQ